MKKILLLLTAAIGMAIAATAQTAPTPYIVNSPANYTKLGDTIDATGGSVTKYITLNKIGDGLVSLTGFTTKTASTVAGVVYLQASDDSTRAIWNIVSDSLTLANTNTLYWKTWKFNKYVNTDLKQCNVRVVFALTGGKAVPGVAYTRRNY